MSTAIKPKRGLESTRTNQTPASGELTVALDTKKFYLGDGSTAGGLEANYMDKTTDESVSGVKTFTNNVIVQGNITVQGTATSVDSNTVNIGDNIMTLNSDEEGTPSQNGGLEIERGTSTNAQMVWDESTDKWSAGEVGSLDYIVLGTELSTHTGTSSIHISINDSGTASDEAWSASKINTQLATKSLSTHDHAADYEPKDTAIQTHLSATSKHREINDSGSGSTDLWSATKIASAIVSGSVADLNGISDVVISNISDNEVLAYDTTTSKWINQLPAEAGLAAAVHAHDSAYETKDSAIQLAVTKVGGMDDNANNYSHPANHAATVITEDSTHRFATDAEKTTWNAKVATGDSRLSDSRDPNAHNHASTDITSFATDVAATASVTANTAKVSNATHTGDVTGDTTLSIGNNKVVLAMMDTMATDSFLGRDTASTGNVEVMSAAAARTILNVADGANDYSHPTSVGNKHVPSGGASGKALVWSSDGTAVWGDVATDSDPIAADTFSGTGSQTDFTMSETPDNDQSILVTISGLRQHVDAYSFSGTTLTFSESPASGTNNIEVVHLRATSAGGSGASVINDLNDVSINSITSGELVVRNSGNDGWENNTLVEAGIQAADADTSKTDVAETRSANIDMDSNVLDNAEISRYIEPTQTVSSSGGTLTLDCSASRDFYTTITENISTFTISNWPTTKRTSITLELTQASTPKSFDWGTIKFPGGEPPDISTGDAIYFVVLTSRDTGSGVYGFLSGSEMS
jgi:hypothetical protein